VGRRTVVVLAGGPGRPAPVSLPADAIVIAADSGAELARELGLRVELVVGDFDSIPPALLAVLERSGTGFERHPTAKDASDLELAVGAALTFDPDRIVVLGGAEGRLDHLLGELLLLSADALSRIVVDAQLGAAAVHVIRGERLLTGRAGELISLFALHGPASGVVTDGLVYELRGESLMPGSSRGLSNIFVASEARVVVESGIVLALRPDGRI
jgi:thiamine pyrophosphokinase